MREGDRGVVAGVSCAEGMVVGRGGVVRGGEGAGDSFDGGVEPLRDDGPPVHPRARLTKMRRTRRRQMDFTLLAWKPILKKVVEQRIVHEGGDAGGGFPPSGTGSKYFFSTTSP